MTSSFGRRPSQAQAASSAPAAAPPGFLRGEPTAPAARAVDPVDAEIREWKKARRSNFPIRLLALVASVSFGVASIALPAQINAWAEWPLFALSGASLYAGFRRRKS
jgi:hypothetical protein